MQNSLRFTKMQGVGNDFVVVDGRKIADYDWSALAAEICDRRFGVGADGLLVLDNTGMADVMMRMYNPDGTPDVCGNGLRCVVRYVIEHRAREGGAEQDTLRVATLAGVRSARIHRAETRAICAVTVQMGQPRFEPEGIPMFVGLQDQVVDYPLELDSGVTLPITALFTGSTHAVTFVEALPDDTTFFSLSPQVEMHEQFPDRTSLMWCAVESPTRLRLRIWERGAGETWGCGTGACAAAVAAIERGVAPADTPITLFSRGGELVVRWREGEPIEMTGPAEFVYEGYYPLDPSRSASR